MGPLTALEDDECRYTFRVPDVYRFRGLGFRWTRSSTVLLQQAETGSPSARSCTYPTARPWALVSLGIPSRVRAPGVEGETSSPSSLRLVQLAGAPFEGVLHGRAVIVPNRGYCLTTEGRRLRLTPGTFRRAARLRVGGLDRFRCPGGSSRVTVWGCGAAQHRAGPGRPDRPRPVGGETVPAEGCRPDAAAITAAWPDSRREPSCRTSPTGHHRDRACEEHDPPGLGQLLGSASRRGPRRRQ